MLYLQIVLLALITGGLVFLGLIIGSARHYLRTRPRPALGPTPPISVVKPLHGIDEGLEDNLVSYFEQDYPDFEIILGVDTADDQALPIAERVRARYPHIPCRILVTGKPPYINPKVYSLEQLTNAVQHDLVVMSDSDIRVTPEHLRVIAAEFADPKLGLVTCPYRAVPGDSFWSRLEAIGMNTEFIAGILVARRLEGMNFSVGPTIACRRKIFEDIGGFPRVKDSYIDDFLVGRYAHEAGWKVELSSYVIEHRIGTQTFRANCKHRVTWLRGTRCSRPAGYYGQVFTYPTPWALVLTLVNSAWWPLLLATLALRALAAHATGEWVLHDPLTRRRWFLVPVQDLWSWFFYWLAYFGRTMTWRGRKYTIQPGGDLTPIVRP
ncbi:MAG: bacteriohopanetetrol glucosamine biosynthesis glycosyltransferase HpnI [Bryobacterales bacterium]|nr:bacteriohopanetetrol glucosamine biosynthesis glycosyltransferase HpnI [Bryobacterales bacterium]